MAQSVPSKETSWVSVTRSSYLDKARTKQRKILPGFGIRILRAGRRCDFVFAQILMITIYTDKMKMTEWITLLHWFKKNRDITNWDKIEQQEYVGQPLKIYDDGIAAMFILEMQGKMNLVYEYQENIEYSKWE